MGGDRTVRHRPVVAARHPHRSLRRRLAHRLRRPPRRRAGRRRLSAHRQQRQRDVGPDRLRPRSGGPGPHRGHGLLVLPGLPAPRGPGPARRRVRPRPHRRRGRHAHTGRLRRVHPAGRSRPRRPLQGLRRHGRRHRLVRGRRLPRRGTPLGRPAQRPPRARDGARLGHEPGRCLERTQRPQRSRPTAGDPRGPRRRGPHPVRRGRRRGARHRHPSGRSDRGAGAAGGLRPEP